MTECRIVPLQIDLVCYDDPTLAEDSEQQLDDGDDSSYNEILDCILPPKLWEDVDGTRWMRKASNRSATRADVVTLAATLETSLQQYQVRDTSICLTRRALYSRCFDEILRQVTVNCVERGLLLLKIRDELKMTMDAWRTMYESNVKCTSLTGPVSSAGPDAGHRIAELEADKRRLERELATATANCETVRSRENELRAAQKRTHDENVELLNRSNRCLKAFLAEMVAVQP